MDHRFVSGFNKFELQVYRGCLDGDIGQTPMDNFEIFTGVRRETASEGWAIRVERVGELKHVVEELQDDVHNEPVRRVGPATLSLEIEKTIEAISKATDLDTDEITTIFSNNPNATLADIAYRLHIQSAHDRASF